MLTLGIESTCDDTAASLVEDGHHILTNVIHSQTDHAAFGGVFPEIASRLHVDAMIPTLHAALQGKRPDLIAVANRPGLMGSLLMGVTAAEALAMAYNVPLIGVNHVEAHLFSSMMNQERLFPALGIVVSGGHTLLMKIVDVNTYEILGQTVDDALGESFDKVATLLGFAYPGGPKIERLAEGGDPYRYSFKGGVVKGAPLDFSFSGLKTNVLYTVKGQGSTKHDAILIDEEAKKDVAASFQRAAFDDLYAKAHLAATRFDCRALYFGGGVTASRTLRQWFEKSPYPLFFPPKGLECDNGAMIAGLGTYLFLRQGAEKALEAYPQMV